RARSQVPALVWRVLWGTSARWPRPLRTPLPPGDFGGLGASGPRVRPSSAAASWPEGIVALLSFLGFGDGAGGGSAAIPRRRGGRDQTSGTHAPRPSFAGPRRSPSA